MSNIDKHIDKQALRGQSVEGSFYLVECCNCGEMYPSNLLDGGEAIADSGDYGDCYCHLCGADDTERADWGDVNSNEAKAWNFQQKRIEALLDELEAAEKRVVELEARMVKLPERYEVDMCPTPSPNGEWFSREDVLAALVSADVSYASGNGKGE
ncbi:ead/Ea22-like family protein [Enterobacter hormaechei]|uniref:ead/Ea22-like family protein n=1 Tax=Enterobacter hormaechei TaxID=158836 RepID=UPI00207C36F5|nr:ead/Ea22-like family protein [Enterobacter hormaechei]